MAAFRGGLGEHGLVENRNVTIEYRWAEGRFERFANFAAELVPRRVDVIAVPGHSGAALAAKAATSDIPIVFGVPGEPGEAPSRAKLRTPGR